jgi:hypothetical protein
MSKARSPRAVSSITMGMRGLMAAFMLVQDRQHIGSIGEDQVAVKASVPCASFARANFATKTSAKPPEVVSKVPAMVGKSPNPVPAVTISRETFKIVAPGPEDLKPSGILYPSRSQQDRSRGGRDNTVTTNRSG